MDRVRRLRPGGARPSDVALAMLCVALISGSGGCAGEYLFGGGYPAQATAPRPASGNMTQIPALSFPSPDIEQRRGLPPETLDQQARIVEVGDEQICFDIALRGLDRSYVDLRSWTPYLRTSEGIRVRSHENVTQPQLREVQTETYQGRIPHQIHMGNETFCSQKDKYEQCVQWSERPVMKTEWTPGEVEVAEGGGTVCFHLAGFDPQALDKLALRLNVADRSLVVNPNASMDQAVAELPGPGRITFQWNCEP